MNVTAHGTNAGELVTVNFRERPVDECRAMRICGIGPARQEGVSAGDSRAIGVGLCRLPRIVLLGTSVNAVGASALFIFSARAKEPLLEGSYSFLSGNRHAVEAFTYIAQDGTLPL